MLSSKQALEMEGIVKRFPGVLAVDRVDFRVREGEIHALLGENGAGKSTLMQVLSGRLVPEEGRVRLDGKPIKLGSPKAAIDQGVGMVYQRFKLVPSLTVAENLLLGRETGRLRLNLSDLSAKITDLGQKFNLPVDPAAHIWRLSMGERQRVEILRLLLFQARILILDEPTTILTPIETVDLFAALKQLKDDGHSIIFISHKLDEVLELSDRISILNRGRMKATIDRAEADKRSLARLMIASDWEPDAVRLGPAQCDPNLTPALELEGITARDEQGLTKLDRLDLTIRCGEVLGVAGVAGNGQRELAEICCGVRRSLSGGIRVNGQDLTGKGSARFIQAGVGFVPEDRHGAGCVVGLNLTENLMLKDYRAKRFQKGLWLNWKAARQQARELIKDYDIRPPDPEAKAGSLSGGNLQKLLLARELSRDPKLIVAAYPLRGLDLASAGFVQSVLSKHRDRGGAVLFIGEDLDSLLEVADRVAVLFRGRIMGLFPNQGLDPHKLGLLMAGEKATSEESP